VIFTLVGDLNVSASKFRFDGIFSNRMIFLTQPQSSIFWVNFLSSGQGQRGRRDIFYCQLFYPTQFPCL
jgi:hypothetical protein